MRNASWNRSLKTLSVLALSILILTGYTEIAGAQIQPPAASAPTFITNAEEVSLDLVVRDKKNRAVLDLKPEDITVTDNGHPVKIIDLRLVTGNSGADHLVTLVFDRFDPSAGKNARDIAGKILKQAPGSGITFSVLKIGDRLRLFQEFTSDRGTLIDAINRATAGDKAGTENDSAAPEKNLIAVAQTGTDTTGASVGMQQRSVARMMLATLQESQRIVQDQHAAPSLAGLLALARTQRQVSGRKIVIYFAQGMQGDSNARDMIRSIVGAANRASVSIYTIDANAIDSDARQGLMATVAIGNVMSNNAQNPAPTGINAPHGPYGPGMASQISDQLTRVENEGLSGYKDPLEELATSTGGAYIGAA